MKTIVLLVWSVLAVFAGARGASAQSGKPNILVIWGDDTGAYVARWLQSFEVFPPRQKPGSFNLDRVLEAVTAGSGQ